MRTQPLLAVAVALVSLALAPGSSAEPPLPSPGVSVPGVDVPCVPSSQHPVPVVLVHGTRSDRTVNWAYLGPELAAAGYCVYSVDLPDRGQAPMKQSLAVLAQRVAEVRAETGAKRVSFLGHSQGGTIARDFVKSYGTQVEDVVTMGTPHHGYWTEPPGDQVDRAFNTGCPACEEQARGSAYLTALNADDMTPGGHTAYTSIITEHDQVALPLPSQYLPEGRQVANVLLQEECPLHVVEHLGLALDPLVRDWVLSALGRPGPADLTRDVTC